MAALLAIVLAFQQAVVAPLTAPLTALDARWVLPFDTPPVAPPGFDASTAYVPLKGGQLVAVDLDRGVVRWRLDVATALTPATGGGLVFTTSDTTIEARDAQTGARIWSAALPGGAAAPLYWDTGWLLASTSSGDLAAFRAADGTLVWRQPLGAPLSTAPAPALDRLYLPLADGRLVAVALATGETIWSQRVSGRITSLVGLDDQLVFGTTEKYVVSVDLLRGRERWKWRVGGDVAGLPAADDKRIYFASRDNVLRAVDRNSGNLRWKAMLSSRPASGPLSLPNAVMVPLGSSEIGAFEPTTGKPLTPIKAAGELGSQPFIRTTARLTSPRLIAVSRDGQLQAFGLRFEPPFVQLDVLPGAPAVP
ncbi:MAG: PQQ-binding-like beta-propeller repeat protein [Acidobacteriota bacterium]|nr:PQQ-binding-like beta-propeller repeat protein [Acidobacteriota bacterium]